MSRRILLVILVLLVVCFAAGALVSASGQTQEQTARKFDEFGDVQPSDMAARLDSFAIELQNNPTTNGFVFAYRSRRDLPGLSSRHVNWIRNYLVYTRGFQAERIKTIDGGVAPTLGYELWIVPPGAVPTPRTDAYTNQYADRSAAEKFDEFWYFTPNDQPESYAGFGDSIEGLADALRKEPTSLAYVIVYSQYDKSGWHEYLNGKGRRVNIDPAGTARRKLQGEKAELVRLGVSPSRIRLVDGGYRKTRAIELWIVPAGEPAPIATPNAFPRQPPRRRK